MGCMVRDGLISFSTVPLSVDRIKPLREAISAFTGYQSTAASPPLIPHLARWRLRLASKRCL